MLVFLHEGLGSVDLWRGFPQALAQRSGFGAVVYSRYGNGFSEVLQEPRRVEYMHDEALVALPELLSALGIERPVLVGHSDGASIALIFAGAFPGRVRALVLEAPHVLVEELSVRSIAQIAETYARTNLRERMQKYHADAEATFRGWNDIWLNPEFRAWSILESLPSILAPAFVVQGAGDEYGTLAQLDEIARRSGGRVDRLILDACGHSPHLDRRDIVEPAAAAWLAAALEERV